VPWYTRDLPRVGPILPLHSVSLMQASAVPILPAARPPGWLPLSTVGSGVASVIQLNRLVQCATRLDSLQNVTDATLVNRAIDSHC
jgi:hypothetical protein